MTVVYLAWSSGATETLARHAAEEPVDLLVSVLELRAFLRVRDRFNINSWCMDSGAFSAHNSGAQIDLADYIAVCKDVDACEVFGLDVIYDDVGTRRNLEAIWSAGIDAIPTFHYGSPESALEWALAGSNKIAIGGISRTHDKRRLVWAQQVFARAWPRRIHGFGAASWQVVRSLPFDSVDASSWMFAPAAMGAWAGYTGRQVPIRARAIRDYWIEVEEHQKRARWAAFRWRKELAKARAA